MSDSDLAAWRPSVVIGSTYLAQGLVAFIGLMMSSRLAQLGTPLEDQVGVLASGLIPWLLKFVFSLLWDLGPSWPLRIRALVSVTLLAGAAAAMGALARAWAPGVPESLVTLGLLWAALNLAMAVQDALVDALALDVLAEHRAFAATGMSLGQALGYGLIGPIWLYPVMLEQGYGPGIELAAIAIAVVALTPALLWVPGRPRKARERAQAERPLEPSDWRWLLAVPLLGMLAIVAPGVTDAISNEFLFVQLRWDPVDHATRLIPLAAIAGVVGALASGFVVARFGPAWTSTGAAALLGSLWLIFVALSPHWAELWPIRGLAGAEGFLQPALMVGLYSLALLAAARSPLPITGFVLMMTALNLARLIGPLLAPRLVLEHGWAAVFTGCGAVLILAAIGLALLARRVVH